MAVLEEYVWLVVVGAFVAFGFGWGTGESINFPATAAVRFGPRRRGRRRRASEPRARLQLAAWNL